MRNFAYASIASMALLLLGNTAHAQDFEAAAKHFGAAQEAFGKKFYQTAAVEFQAAFEITKDPILLYNIGEAWQKAGEAKKAVSAYKAYLKAQPAAQDKAEVARRVKLIEASSSRSRASRRRATRTRRWPRSRRPRGSRRRRPRRRRHPSPRSSPRPLSLRGPASRRR